MINALIVGLFKIITKLISVILLPINLAIMNFLPDFNTALSSVASIFNYGGQFVGWILDSLLINSTTISFLVSVWVFKLSFPIVISTIKLIIQWYDSLKV